MSLAVPHVLPSRPPPRLRRAALGSALAVGLLLVSVATVIAGWMDWGAALALQALAVFALGALLVQYGLAGHAPHERFGAANGLTLTRLAMIALLAGVAGRPLPADPAPLAWGIVVFATITAVPDAAKGERLVAFYTDPAVTPQTLWVRLTRTELPRLWLPKREDLRHVEAIPTLGTGKVDLRAVRQLAADLREEAAS